MTITYLTVPGLHGSGAAHWQTLWERMLPNCRRAWLGDWDDPRPDAWTSRLTDAVEGQDGPVMLIAHSLGCHAVARLGQGRPPAGIVGALLVAPPDVERTDDDRLRRFAPVPDGALPFSAALVASRDDPYCDIACAAALSRTWGCALHDIGAAGHINACSGLGDWPEGRRFVAALTDACVSP